MGLKSGDKARYYRQRNKQNTRRAAMREFLATLKQKAAGGAPARPTSAPSA